MRPQSFSLILLISMATAMGCNLNDALPPVDFVKWVENPANGFRVSKNTQEFVYTLQYQPIAYLVAREKRSNSLSKALLEQETDARKDLQYFNFRIALADGSSSGSLLKHNLHDPAEFEQRVAYFSSAMQNDLSLVCGKDTLPCLLFHFERIYDVAPYTNFLLGFQLGTEERQDLQFIYDDKILGTDPVLLVVKADALRNIPPIKAN